MCNGRHRSVSPGGQIPPRRDHRPQNDYATAVQDLRGRLADTEALLDQTRARQAEIACRLDELKRMVSVMEIVKSYLERKFRHHRDLVTRLLSTVQAP